MGGIRKSITPAFGFASRLRNYDVSVILIVSATLTDDLSFSYFLT